MFIQELLKLCVKGPWFILELIFYGCLSISAANVAIFTALVFTRQTLVIQTAC